MFKKQIRRVRNGLLFAAFLGVAGYVAYQILLDDRAKQDINGMVTTVRDSAMQLGDMVNERIGTIMDEDVVAQNREQIKEAWAALGY